MSDLPALDPDTFAALTAQDEQEKAAQKHDATTTAEVIGTYYKALKDNGVPAALAGKLTICYLDYLLDTVDLTDND